MNAVDPIKSLEDIRKMKEFLAKKPRNALLFSFGINSGLRISDILALNVGDVRGKEYIEIRELKTGKRKVFPINDRLKRRLKNLLKECQRINHCFIHRREDEWKGVGRIRF